MEVNTKTVSVVKANGGYPAVFPFDPDQRYPEYRGPAISAERNHVYDAVRRSFELLGYDRENFGKPEWNPLGHLVKPGDRVFIKPNLCSHEYGRKKEAIAGDVYSVITHPSVVRAVADYVAIALQGSGEMVIGDNPTIDTNFSTLLSVTHLDKFAGYYQQAYGVRCAVLDLREAWCDDIRKYGKKALMTKLPGDPQGDSVINLGEQSFFYGLNPLLYRGVFTSRWETIKHHHGKTQEYAVANSIFQSDVYISIPKLKTHHKVGATLNIKGLVGICTKKNYLIHWRIGFPSWGGDEYPPPRRKSDHVRLFLKHLGITVTPTWFSEWVSKKLKGRWIEKLFRVEGYRGAWEGNDTCWRMSADLYLSLMARNRRCFTVIDGIVGGDGNGPFCTGRKEAHTLIASDNLLLADCVAVRCMDFRIEWIRYLTGLLQRLKLDVKDIRVVSKDYETDDFFSDQRRLLEYAAPSSWPHLPMHESRP